LPFLLFGEPLIRLIFGPAYVGATIPLAILIVGQVANALFGAVTAIAIAARREAGALGAHAVSTIGNLLLCVVLVPRFGAAGAAAASAVSLIVWNLLIFLHLRREVGISSFVGWNKPGQNS
jgi:O-antigen/teichoic acid export membrane protein